MPRVPAEGAGTGLGDGPGDVEGLGDGNAVGVGEGLGEGEGLGGGGGGGAAPASNGRMSPTLVLAELPSSGTPYASSRPRSVPYSLPPLAAVPWAEPMTRVRTCSVDAPSSQVMMIR